MSSEGLCTAACNSNRSGTSRKAKLKSRLIGNLKPDEWDLPPKPKWMRWRTYNRFVDPYEAYEDILDRGLVPRGDDSFRHECDIIERAVAGKDLRYVAVGLGYSPKRRRQNRFDLFVLLDEVIVTRNE
jgi:hypothetical protein